MADDIAISVRNLTKTYRLFAHSGVRSKIPPAQWIDYPIKPAANFRTKWRPMRTSPVWSEQ